MTTLYRALLALSVVGIAGMAFSGTLVVRQDGAGGAYTVIQTAINAATSGDTISVEDNGIYTENLIFTTSSLTLKAAVGATPTVNLTGSISPDNKYIDATEDLTTIEGITITFTGTPDDNVYMVLGGSNATMRNCTVIGAQALLRGLGNIATLDHVDISNCYQAVIYDSPTLVGLVEHCYIHDNTGHNSFSKGDITIVDTEITRCQRGLYTSSLSTANVTLTSCTLSDATDRNVIRVAPDQTTIPPVVPGVVTFNYCTLSGGGPDITLLHGGDTYFNNCLLLNPSSGGRCILIDGGTSFHTNVYLDHCDLVGSVDQWAIIDNSGMNDNMIYVKNSIITGFQGIHDATGNTWVITDYNDIYCTDANYSGTTVPGVHDLSADPFYIQTTGALADDYYKLRWFSPCAHADEFGGVLGARGIEAMPPSTGARSWSLYQ